MAELRRIPGVGKVNVTDTWPPDHWYNILVELEPKSSVDGHRQYGKTFEINTHKNYRSVTVYNIPDMKRTLHAIRKAVAQSELTLESPIVGPSKVYEYQDEWDRRQRTPRAGGYEHNDVFIELYDN
jgi:hypothetical protein